MENSRILCLFGILVFICQYESVLMFTDPVVSMVRSCIQVPKHLHTPVLNNDCESVMDEPNLPENKLVTSNETDSRKNPNEDDITVDWLVGAPYISPYSGKETKITFDFEVVNDENSQTILKLERVMPFLEYSDDEEKYFAKYLTAETIASEPDTSKGLDSGAVINRKLIQTTMKIPKSIPCDIPIDFKIRFYTDEVPGQGTLDYMYITYLAVISEC